MKKKPAAQAPSRGMLAWAIPVVAVAILGGFLLGQRSGARDAKAAESLAAAGSQSSLGGAATDIGAMSPDERASRLYDRIMLYSEQGRLDSARTFAPMALQAYEALGKPDAHTHYDVGMILAAVGDSSRARSEAETILKDRPTHLLGLLLATRTAATPSLRATYSRRFLAATKQELASPLPEYAEHRHDIDGAIQASQTAKK